MSFGRAVAAVAEAGAVVVAADARFQAHAVDDVAGLAVRHCISNNGLMRFCIG